MILTITHHAAPATDLGYLLHKNPARTHSTELSFGKAHVFFPEVTAERCTAALLLDVDPVGLVRKKGGPSSDAFALEQYVNDRPYVASSFMSVALGRVFGTALGGRSKERQTLAEQALPLVAELAVVPVRGGEGEVLLRRLFEPLGYQVAVNRHPLDERFPDWGPSPYYSFTIRGEVRLQDLLAHLYVLLPVLDNEKHYWVGDAEVEKLLRRGETWLASHPEKDLIARRYLKHRRGLVDAALAQLVAPEDAEDPDETERAHDQEEATVEAPVRLNDQRMEAVLAALRGCGAKRVLDLGCGEGRLVRLLLGEKQFEEIIGIDVSHRSLQRASERLKLDRLPESQRQRVRLMQGSLTYRDRRLAGYDAAAIVEVIEHLDPPRLAAFERVVFEFARPKTVVLTTPNAEYNVRFESLPAGKFRHRDHRFEWTREEFQGWSQRVGERFGYEVGFSPVGPVDEDVGAPTQMAIFKVE